MTRELFESLATKYLEDVRSEALALFDRGLAHDRCIPVAINVVDAIDIAKARNAQVVVAPPLTRTARGPANGR